MTGGPHSPLHRLIEDIAVGSVFGRECVAAILHTKHHQRFGGVIAHAAASVGSHTDNRPLFDEKDLAVNLKLTFATEEEVKFLMILMGVEKTGFLPGDENLE